MSWDIERLRTIAGLETPVNLNESYDDDGDDEDEDVKRADSEAKKRGIKLPKVKVDVEKDLENVAHAKTVKEKEAEADAAAKHAEHEKKESPAKEKAEHAGKAPSPAAEKKESPASEKKEEKSVAKPEEKKEPKTEEKKEAAAEAKRRGKAPNADSKRQKLHAYLKANPGVKRSVAMKWAQENLEMGSAYASQQIQAVKAQIVKEAFMLYHPTVPNFVLHENKNIGIYQWISENDNGSDQEPLMFATLAEATKVANYLFDFNNQLTDVKRIDLDN
jgi:flagellar biosynthesis GTPase FlhF